MKKYLYLPVIILLMFKMSGCTLDLENIQNYTADRVWEDEKLANAYLTNLYPGVFGNWNVSLEQKSQQLAGIHFYKDRIVTTNAEYKLWSYSTIFLINDALAKIEKSQLLEATKNNLNGQLYFLRAYVYFNMVSFHGGIPYLTVAQDKDKDDLYVTRNSTKECFELLIKDLDAAIALLPHRIDRSSTQFGRVDGCFAQAFKAKVLLCKASPQFNPSNPWDNSYWEEAFKANEKAYNDLVAKGAALTPAYEDIFFNERGPETVFSVINTYPKKTANWDLGVRPGSESRDVAYANPTWDFVKEFPMKDGKLYSDPSGKYHLSDEAFLQGFWKNRDPRFEKSLVWNGCIYEVSGKKGKRQYTSIGIAHTNDDFGTNPNAKVNSTNLNRASGFFIRKASKLSLLQSEVQQYDVDYIVMRFAEVMMNYAETANETGRSEIALSMLKAIRQRAGIEPGDDELYGLDGSSRESIREALIAERNIEFCFEGFRFWDLRRLRMLDRLDGKTKSGVEAIAINQDGTEMSLSEAKKLAGNNKLTESDFKYIVHQIPFSGVKVQFVPDKYVFFPIRNSSIDRNEKLEQNVDWGGNFNPTLE